MTAPEDIRELEEWLHRGGEPAAPAWLRVRVLARVDGELKNSRTARWDGYAAAATAALVLLAVALNAWVMRHGEQHLARFLGPRTAPSHLRQWTETVAEVTGPAAARKLQEQLIQRGLVPHRPLRPQQRTDAIEQLIRELAERQVATDTPSPG